MTYDIIERSVYEGEPIELYTFTRVSQFWRFTSGDEDINVSGNIFSSVPIERSKVEQTQDPGRNNITIKAPRTLSFVQQYISSPPSDIVSLTIQRFHVTDGDDQVVVLWLGRVVNVKFEGNNVTIRCEPIFTALKRPALRRLYQTTCPHVLYGPVCKFLSTTLQLNTTVDITDSTTLTSADFALQADGFYTGGFIEWETGGVVNKRFILTHVGAVITINLALPGIANGAAIRAFPGCDHTLDTCVNKFSNQENYGGFPYIPAKNPFDGTPVF